MSLDIFDEAKLHKENRFAKYIQQTGFYVQRKQLTMHLRLGYTNTKKTLTHC